MVPATQHSQAAGDDVIRLSEVLCGEGEGSVLRRHDGLRDVDHALPLPASTVAASGSHCTDAQLALARAMLVGSVHEPST